MSAGSRVAAFAVAFVVLAAPGGARGQAAPVEDVDDKLVREFGDAIGAYRDGLLDEAIERILRVLDMDRDDPDALWNLGLWTAEAGRPEESVAAWLRYAEVAPGDWRVRPKLIQAYQALERNTDRDREREALRARWQAGAEPTLSDSPVFCRDQFAAAGRPVYAMEWFAPDGTRPVTIEFRVIADGGKSEAAYLLASWDDHNTVPWEESPNSRTHRTYHLARTGRGGRETVAWYQGEPHYELVRRHVAKDLEARAARASRSAGD